MQWWCSVTAGGELTGTDAIGVSGNIRKIAKRNRCNGGAW